MPASRGDGFAEGRGAVRPEGHGRALPLSYAPAAERGRGGGLTKQEFEGRINREIEKKKSAQVDLVKKLGVGAESVIVGRAGGIRRSLGATSGQKRSGTAPVTRTPFPVYRLTVRLFEYFLVGATGIEPVTP